METPMNMECQSPAGPSMTSTACFTKGCLDKKEAEKVALDHSCGNCMLSLNCKEPAFLPGEEAQSQYNEEKRSQDALAALMYDKNCRKSSLGADSLLDQDFSEDGAIDTEGIPILTAFESLLGLQYADDIYQMKKLLESKYHPTKCMADQPQVTEYMRCTLVHWLIKINRQLQFEPETIFLAVNISDRFLTVTPLAQDCLQLLAVTSLFVAAKMEEKIVPGISKLVAMCGETYKPHHFRMMEILILSTLEFVLYEPTSWYFIEHLTLKASQISAFDRRVVSVARYVLETCLSNYEISQFLPSVQAAGAMMMSINAVPCSPVHLTTLSELLEDLYSASECQDTVICTSLMSRYMAPFISCIDSEHQHFTPACDVPESQKPEQLIIIRLRQGDPF